MELIQAPCLNNRQAVWPIRHGGFFSLLLLITYSAPRTAEFNQHRPIIMADAVLCRAGNGESQKELEVSDQTQKLNKD